jgi:hypothetical protein
MTTPAYTTDHEEDWSMRVWRVVVGILGCVLFASGLAPAGERQANRELERSRIVPLPFAVVELFTSEG